MHSPVRLHLTQAALLDDLLGERLERGESLQAVRQAKGQRWLRQGHRGAQIAQQRAEQQRAKQLQLDVLTHFDSSTTQ